MWADAILAFQVDSRRIGSDLLTSRKSWFVERAREKGDGREAVPLPLSPPGGDDAIARRPRS